MSPIRFLVPTLLCLLLAGPVFAEEPDADEGAYLEALSLFQAEKYAETLDSVERLAAGVETSPWYRKARFLKARALVELRRFQEAEAIYEAEARRLLGEERKTEIANLILAFADALAKKPDPDDVGAPPPDYTKAWTLYRKVLEMEIGRALRDEVMRKSAVTIQAARDHNRAVGEFRAYLAEFDPDWAGPYGSPDRLANRKRENPPPAGRHILECRYRLGLSQRAIGQAAAARRNFEDLLGMIGPVSADPASTLAADTRWQIILTHGLPGGTLEAGLRAVRDFLGQHSKDPRAVFAAWLTPEAFRQHGRSDQAIKAYAAFIDSAAKFIEAMGATATDKHPDLPKSPAELFEDWRKLAVFRTGQIRFAQKEYSAAIEDWRRYVNSFPNGPNWADAQRGIVDAEYEMGVEAVASEDYPTARRLFGSFLAKHPLDRRARAILFTLGQIHYARAQEEAEAKEMTKATASFEEAAAHWERLVAKYPNTEESSLALYRVGIIHEERLGDLEKALAAYRRLTWGSCAQKARARVAAMTGKSLTLTTERTFRTNEAPKVSLKLRNIEKLTVRQYFLDLEAFFRKTHGTGGVDALDIALIQPDKTWEFEVGDYAKYRPINEEVEIPFPKGRAGVCLVNVSEDDWEATTLVIRSDIDLIVKSSRREILVFAQDMLRGMPAVGVDLLLSDGAKVIATGKTGKDGVFRNRLEELENLGNVRVFASRSGSVAGNQLNLKNLGLSHGLSPRGYVYTDRSAYRPGQTVNLRAILREVSDGSYAVPQDKVWQVAVTDSQGRLLWTEEKDLSEFGTLHTSLDLDASAPLGEYVVTVRPASDSKSIYRGSFLVMEFKLEKMKLTLETDRKVYFRGEKAELTIAAEYYWGEPVGGSQIRYVLPDGRTFVEKAGDDGKLVISYDTIGLAPGSAMLFRASIEGENVSASHRAFLATSGFGLSVASSRDLVLSGEPFTVTVTAKTPDGEPTAKPVTLSVLRRSVPRPDPVLSGVPWIGRPARPAAELTVRELKGSTDEEAGVATFRLSLEEGGKYVLRVSSEDRFDQVVSAEGTVTISDDKDAVKLRFFAESSTLKVGEKAEVRLHSRLDAGLALVTYDGEEILSHRVMKLGEGMNDLAIDIDHEHFPNFRVTVAAFDGRDLRTAAIPFTVERELKVTVTPLADVYAPGEEGRVKLRVVDQLGKPVKAELSLSLVDEALFALYPDRTPKILEFFQKGALRHSEFRVTGTVGFQYTGKTRAVIKAFLEEAERHLRKEAEAAELAKLKKDMPRLSGRMRRAPGPARQPSEGMPPTGGGAPPTPAPSPEPAAKGWADKLADRDARGAEAQPEAREELPEAGFWSASVTTGSDGTAVVTLPMPENTTEWRLTARGVSVETLVGEATGNVVTRKDFFVDLKVPSSLQEGDRVRVLARVHNLTSTGGAARLTLVVRGGEKLDRRLLERTVSAEIEPGKTTEVLFDSFEVPGETGLSLEVTASVGDLRDAVVVRLPVRPWGVEYTDHAGGVGKNDSAATLELPGDRKYSSRWLTVSVGPSLERAVLEMAFGGPVRRFDAAPPSWGGHPGGDLIAAASAVKYAKAVQAPRSELSRLLRRARSLAGTLVVTQQRDGGWAWSGRKAKSDLAVTCRTYWALNLARGEGLAVHPKTLSAAKSWLLNAFRRLGASDNDGKAMILHALSTGGAAEFAHANRLYRERNTLTSSALAHTALAFMNLKRSEFAKELLDVLLSKAAVPVKRDGRELFSVRPASKLPYLSHDDVETTALTLLVMLEIRPQDRKVREAVHFLLDRRGCYGFASGKARGPAVAALAGYYGEGRYAETDARIKVLVGGKEVRTISARGSLPIETFRVPGEFLADGRLLVEFRMEGRGEYSWAATLRGFSPDLKGTKNFDSVSAYERNYYHAPLRYRGREIGVSSSSPVRNAEVGQRIHVKVRMHTGYTKGYWVLEEPIPSGMVFVEGSLKGRSVQHILRDGRLTLLFPPKTHIPDIHYDLVAYATGDYPVLPTMIRNALNPGDYHVGRRSEISVLPPGVASDDTYVMNFSEHRKLAQLLFADGLYQEALGHLITLRRKARTSPERDVARMLLWIYTSEGFYDARGIVDVFEVLRERYPELEIPFDKILVVGRAYRDIGEYERAWLVFRATIDASFITDAGVSAVLEDGGQFLGSIAYQEDLWREYPDTAEVVTAYFVLSQALYKTAPRAHLLAKQERRIAVASGREDEGEKPAPTRIEMLKETVRILESFLRLYPKDPLADDAAFSMANAWLDLKQHELVVDVCRYFGKEFPESDFSSGFRYMEALGHFWQRAYEPALKAAKTVAEGKSRDRDFARYIAGQINHAQGSPAEAIRWYEMVKGQYADAKEAIEYFEAKRIELPEVTIVKPGETVEFELAYRNVKEASLQVYRVDLMKLYLREKNLSSITKVHLAGIQPELEKTIELGDGKDYVDKEWKTTLDLEDEAAYLVICRGDDLFASGLVLITPLTCEVQEDARSGRVRVNVLDRAEEGYASEVHVKAIGSADTKFKSGDTDLRGIFVADGIRGTVTVIARAGESRYAFFRGEKWLGAPQNVRRPPTQGRAPGSGAIDYRKNLGSQNDAIQDFNLQQYDKMRRSRQGGVQIQKAR